MALLTTGRLDAPGASGAHFSSLGTPARQHAADLAAQFATTSMGHPVFGAAAALELRGGGGAAAAAWRALAERRALAALPPVGTLIGDRDAYIAAAACLIGSAVRSEGGVGSRPYAAGCTQAHHQGQHFKEEIRAADGQQVDDPAGVDVPEALVAVAEGFGDASCWRGTHDSDSGTSVARLMRTAALLAYACAGCAKLLRAESKSGTQGMWLLQSSVGEVVRATGEQAAGEALLVARTECAAAAGVGDEELRHLLLRGAAATDLAGASFAGVREALMAAAQV